MSDFQAIADRVEIEALRGEFTDAAMMLDPYGVAEPLAARGIRARRFTSRDHDQILMTVPFDRLPTAYPYALLAAKPITESNLSDVLFRDGTDASEDEGDQHFG